MGTLCYTCPGSTSGESVKERSVAHPFLTATVIALLSLPLVLLDCREYEIRWRLLVRQYAGQYTGPG